MRWKLWVLISLCLHASLVAAAMLYVVEDKPVTPEPISIQMLAFAADEPAGEPEPVVEEVTPPEPEPVVEPEPEPEPIPDVKPIIEKPIEKKPEPKPKPKPKPVDKPKPPVERPQPLVVNKGNDLKNLNPTAKPSDKGDEKPVAVASSGEGKVPNVVRQGLPEYPSRARAVGMEGSIKVRFDVDADGRVDNVEIISADPKNVFEREVKRAMRQWRYEKIPYKGKVVLIEFKMTGISAS